jgi:hypothetical protein
MSKWVLSKLQASTNAYLLDDVAYWDWVMRIPIWDYSRLFKLHLLVSIEVVLNVKSALIVSKQVYWVHIAKVDRLARLNAKFMHYKF